MVLDDFYYQSKQAARGPAGAPQGQLPSSPAEVIERSLASPVDRLAATVADFILAIPVLGLIVSPLSRQAKEAQILGADDAWVMSVLSAIALAAFSLVLFQTISVAVFGATPGKWVLRLRVVSMWTGEKPQPLEAFSRAFVWCLGFAFLGVPLLSVFSNLRRRPFHDRIADTAVVSLNPGRRAGLALLPEMSIFSGFQAACLSMFLMALIVNFVRYQHHHDSNLEAALKHEDEGRLCREVRESIQDSPERSAGLADDRLEVALMLFNSAGLTSECLDQEAEFALWSDQALPLAYLAKGLALAERSESTSVTYLKRACEKARASEQPEEYVDVCRLGILARAGLAAEDHSAAEDDPNEAKIEEARRDAEIAAVIAGINEKSETFLKVAVIKKLTAEGDDERVLPILDSVRDSKLLGGFVARERAKVLWRLGQKSESLVAMRSVADMSDHTVRVETASWFCRNETEFGSCGKFSQNACGELKSAVEKSDAQLKKPEVAAAYIRAQACALDKPNWREVAAKIPLGDAKDYLESLALLDEGDTGGGIEKLVKLADGATTTSFVVEANRKLIERSQTLDELKEYLSKWDRIDSSKSEWQTIGRLILAKLSQMGAWDEAIKIGLRIIKSDPGDRQTYALMINAAKSGGKLSMALGLLSQIPGRKPASHQPLDKAAPQGASAKEGL